VGRTDEDPIADRVRAVEQHTERLLYLDDNARSGIDAAGSCETPLAAVSCNLCGSDDFSKGFNYSAGIIHVLVQSRLRPSVS
jgi:hypothetical protein